MFSFLKKKKVKDFNEENTKLLFSVDENYEKIAEVLVKYINENYKVTEMHNYTYNIDQFYSVLHKEVQKQIQVLDELEVFGESNKAIIKRCRKSVADIEAFNVRFPMKFLNPEIQNIVIDQFPPLKIIVSAFYEKSTNTIKRLFPASELSTLVNEIEQLTKEREIIVENLKKQLIEEKLVVP